MTAPDPAAAVQDPPEVVAPAVAPDPTSPDPAAAEQAPSAPDPEPESSPEDDLPKWARDKISKIGRENQGLRQRLKEQEPAVAAAQEAERAKMSELDREKADNAALREQLAQRDTDVLRERFQLSDEDLEFIGDGTFDERAKRAEYLTSRTQAAAPAEPDPTRPPTQRPVESLRPGASPTPPPVPDTSYPAAWKPRD